jgi:tRNA nucleotidyltransferase (CCA-adding enzyme)
MASSDVNPLPSISLYGQSWQTILTSILPTKEDELKLKSCFDKIKRILTDEYKLGNLFKVGSYGKNTHIKMDNKLSDIDIVILYPKFNPTEEEY